MKLEILYKARNKQYAKTHKTFTDAYQFEKNCKAEFIAENITNKINHIEKHKSFIGKEVFKFKKSFNYTDVLPEENIGHNPVFEQKVLFTPQLLNSFLYDYFQFSKEYLIKRLVENQITCNSTNKLSNLQFEWQLECTQQLIKLYTEILES